jgi:hypothetical protein
MRRIARAALCVLGVSALSFRAEAQPFGASGPEFRVNTTTTGYQDLPAVGLDASGGFLVTWKSGFHGLLAQRYSARSAPIGGEFAVNTSTSFFPYWPSVVGQGPGDFVVVWENGVVNEPTTIIAQRVSGGALAGGAFRVDTGATAYDQRPAVAPTTNGAFAVVWGRSPASSNNWDLFARRLSSAGDPIGDEFHVSTTTTSQHSGAPSLARRSDGSFLVSWTPNSFPAAVGQVFVRRYSSTGTEGSIVEVNDPFSSGSTTPGAAYDAAGNYVVVWGGSFVWGQRYTSLGDPRGGIFRVDNATLTPPNATAVGSDALGNFVVVWGVGAFGQDYTIYGRRFASSGASLSPPFRISTITTGSPRFGGMAMTTSGDFVVVWEQGGFPNGDVFGRFFCHAFAGDANGDGTLDVSDVFYLINALFAGGPSPVQGSDANGDGSTDIGDVFTIINYLFASGPAPVCAPVG